MLGIVGLHLGDKSGVDLQSESQDSTVTKTSNISQLSDMASVSLLSYLIGSRGPIRHTRPMRTANCLLEGSRGRASDLATVQTFKQLSRWEYHGT